MDTINQNSGDGNRSAAMHQQQPSSGAKFNPASNNTYPTREGKRPIYIKDLPRIHPAISDAGV